MPLWRIFSHPTTFSPSQREALAKDITAYYVGRNLPAFYVNVVVSSLSHPSPSFFPPCCFPCFVFLTFFALKRKLMMVDA
jgi:hypothetical protein